MNLSLLQAIKVILSKEPGLQQEDWADSLSASLKEELEASIKEADSGDTISHAYAMQQIRDKYPI